MSVRSFLREALGIAICVAAFMGADALGRRVTLPLPPGIVGAIVLAGLAASGVLPLPLVAPGADRLLRHLGMLFVPAAVLALRQRAVLAPAIGSIVFIVSLSSVVGMVVAGVVTERLARGDGAKGEDAAAAREEEPGT
jgi:holin-like protein